MSDRTGRRWRSGLEAENRRGPAASSASTSFVGRTSALEAIDAHLASPRRLLTVTGPPGIGKTRLVLEWLRTRGNIASAEEPAVFCDLRQIDSVSSLVAELAGGLGVELSRVGEAGVEALGWILRSRGTGLVVLDNFDSLVGEGASTLGLWLDRAPTTRVVVTSRIRLALKGEAVLEVGPLGFAAEDQFEIASSHKSQDERGSGSEAVGLFWARARERDPSLTVESFPRDEVARLVRALQGLPLAIELAAAQLRVRDVGEVLDDLTRSALQLEDPDRDPDPRHRTLHAAIDRSWHLLGEGERVALRQLSVFRNGFTLDAARAVVRVPAGEPGVDEVVGSLRDASLLRVVGLDSSSRRWDLFEAIRQFAAHQLKDSGEEDGTRDRHAVFYRVRGAEWVAQLSSSVGVQTRARLSVERENLGAAFEWLDTTNPGDLGPWVTTAVVVQHACLGRSPDQVIAVGDRVFNQVPLSSIPGSSRGVVEGSIRASLARLVALRESGAIEAAKEASGDARRRTELGRASGTLSDDAAALLGAEIDCEASQIHLHHGSVADARECLERALAASQRYGDPRVEGRVRSKLAWVLAEGFRDERAFEHHAIAVECFRNAGDVYRETQARWLWALHRIFFERTGEIDGIVEQWEATTRRVDDRQARAIAANALAIHHHSRREWAKAEAMGRLAFRLATQSGVRRFRGVAALTIGIVLDALEEPRSLLEISGWYEQAVVVFAELGDRRYEGLATLHLGGVRARSGEIEDASRLLERARVLIEPTRDHAFLGLIDLQYALLDRAHAQRALAVGDEVEASRLDRLAAGRAVRAQTDPALGQAMPLARCCIEARNLLGVLQRERRLFDRRNQILRMDPSGRSFSYRGGAACQLPDGPVIRGVLLALVDERRRQPGNPVEANDLLDRAWGGERMLAAAGLRRVRDVVVRLRRLGLEDVVITSPKGGYLVDPTIPVFLGSPSLETRTTSN